MILTPSRKIIRPSSRFRTLDDLRRANHKLKPDVALRLQAMVAVNKGGKCLGRETFECRSFNANWMRILRLLMLGREELISHAEGDVQRTVGFFNDYNLYGISSEGSNFLEHCGPVIGVGTTTQTPNDTRMEKQICHGSVAPNASVLTGTAHASQSTTSALYDDGSNALTNDQYNHYILEITSGAMNGQERIIFDTVDSTYDYFLVASSTSEIQGHFASEPDGVTYKVKTYGMMSHGASALTTPTDNGGLISITSISRNFDNGCGQTLDVTEFGLKLRMYTDEPSGHDRCRVLVARDVRVTPVSIANGNSLTLTYTLSCEA